MWRSQRHRLPQLSVTAPICDSSVRKDTGFCSRTSLSSSSSLPGRGHSPRHEPSGPGILPANGYKADMSYLSFHEQLAATKSVIRIQAPPGKASRSVPVALMTISNRLLPECQGTSRARTAWCWLFCKQCGLFLGPFSFPRICTAAQKLMHHAKGKDCRN